MKSEFIQTYFAFNLTKNPLENFIIISNSRIGENRTRWELNIRTVTDPVRSPI